MRVAKSACVVFRHAPGTTVLSCSFVANLYGLLCAYLNVHDYQLAHPVGDSVSDMVFVGKEPVCCRHSPTDLRSAQ